MHPESRPKHQSSHPNIGCDSNTTNPDVSNITETNSTKGNVTRNGSRGKSSTSQTRQTINLKMPSNKKVNMI